MPTHQWIPIQERPRKTPSKVIENKPKKNKGYLWRIPLSLFILILGIIWFVFSFMINMISAACDGAGFGQGMHHEPSISFNSATFLLKEAIKLIRC